jgi:hypothetical protein
LTAPRRTSSNRQDKSAEPDEGPAKIVIPSQYVIRWDREYVDALLRSHDQKGYLALAPERLKYHPFLVSRNPAKPPGILAKATLMANNPNSLNAAEVVAEIDDSGLPSTQTEILPTPDEITLHGEDQATLDLVQALAHASPQRSLRKRASSERNSSLTPLSSVKRLRSMDSTKASITQTPSTRHSRRVGSMREELVEATDLTPSRRRLKGDVRKFDGQILAEPIEIAPAKPAANGDESDDPLRLYTPQKVSGQMFDQEDVGADADGEQNVIQGDADMDADGEYEAEYLGDEEDAEGEEEDAEGEEDDDYVG